MPAASCGFSIRMLLLAVLTGTAWVGVANSNCRADNWPQWRGPHNNGICDEKGLPVKWSKTENVAFKLAMPGPGMGTPVVWGDRIFLNSVIGNDLALLCVGTDGEEKWRRTIAQGNRPVRGDEGNMATPSPSTDGKHVFVFMAEGTLAAFDFAGNQLWKSYLPDIYGKNGSFDIAFGLSSTPVLDGDRLYLQLLFSGGAHVIALDKTTGNEVWKQNRPSDCTDECEHSYASPIIYDDGKQKFLITHGGDYVVGHDLTDGHELFRCGGMNPKDRYNPTLRFVASPAAAEGLIVVPSAKNGPVLALLPTANGDITAQPQYRPWTRAENTPDVPSPLIHDGLVYLCRENGNLLVLDAKTGKEQYERPTVRDRHRSSPIYADGHIYLTARNGEVTVVRAGRTFEKVGENQLDEATAASLAVSNGRIYIRTFDHLWAIGK